ncbi:hypothetical protein CPB85DRAFT_1304931 [Mucidula mucida]|nr:hypothetical protein CPB85DRAFT_1304931 [Mucidula mucida]
MALHLLLVACVSFLTVQAHQSSAYLEAFEEFLHGFIDSDIVAAGESPSLASDCVGRVDLTTTFVGSQLNTEYLYGLFSDVASLDTTQLLGVPIDASAQSIAIEGSLVSASVILSMLYKTISYTLPVQADMWLDFNDDLKIRSYDVSFRKFPEAFPYLLPKLGPQIATELETEYSAANLSTLVAHRAAIDICTVSTEFCTGDNQQYSSHDACMQFMLKDVPFGEIWQAGRNTTVCRYIHKNMVKFRPEVHCAHIGPSGGDMCIPRDYEQVATAFPFSHALVAPSGTFSSEDVKGFSNQTLQELAKIVMQQVYPTTVAFYPIPTLIYAVILYIMAKGVQLGLVRWSPNFRALSFENQRNTVTYVLNTIWTTVALVFQGLSSPMLRQEYSLESLSQLRIAAVIVSVLYIFELTYRPSMRWPLMIHHSCTLFAIIFVQIILQITMHPALAVVGVIWLFQATTEQTVFIGLFMYRLRYPKRMVQNLLKFAAVQSFLCKFGFAVYLLVWWAMKLARFTTSADIALSVMLVTICTLLMATQVYGSWAVWCVATNMDRSRRTTNDLEKCATSTTTFTASSMEDKLAESSVVSSTASLA